MDGQRLKHLRTFPGRQGPIELLECIREIQRLQSLVEDINTLAILEGEKKDFSVKVQKMILNQ